MSRQSRVRQLAQFTLALCLLTPALGQTEAQNLLRQATTLMRGAASREKTTEAIAVLKRAIALHPDFVDAHIELAVCHRSLGQYDEGIAAATEAVRLRPKSSRALALLASCHTLVAGTRPADAIRHYEEALRIHREMVRIDPKDFGAYYRLANLLRTKFDRREEALAACREALRLKPEFAEAHVELGECLWPSVESPPDAAGPAYASSIAAFREAIRLKRDYPHAYRSLAETFTRSGRAEEAIATLRKGIEACAKVTHIRPGLGDLYLALGRIYLAAGDRAAAQKVNDELIAADPRFPRLLTAEITRAMAAANPSGGVIVVGHADDKTTERRVTTPEEARQALGPGRNTVVLLGDPSADAYNRGVVAQGAGNQAAAIAAYQEALRLKPDFAEAHLNLGHAFLHTGRAEEALASYRDAVRVRPDFALGHYAIGLWFEQRKQLPEAITAYREAVRLAPTRADMHQKLGNIYLFSQRFDEAIASYQAGLAVDPRHADAWMSLGMTHLYLGQRAEAIEAQSKLQPLHAGHAASLQSLIDGKARLPNLE